MDAYLCKEQTCDSKKVEILCICDNIEHYLCWKHYIRHITTCIHATHQTRQIIWPNPEICDKIEDKLNWVSEEIEKLKELIRTELKKLEDFYHKALINVLNSGKRLISELQAAKEACNLLFEKIKKPIIKKDYYPPLEYLLINKDPSYSQSIIDQIKPPAIEDIKLEKNMWKKISFQSADFTYLLNSYNSYCFAHKGTETIVYTDIKGTEKSIKNDLIDTSSRFMPINPTEILVTGGSLKPESCFIIDIKNQSIISQNNMNNPRFWHCCAFIKGFPAVIGGRFENQNIASVESFENGIWRDLPPLNHARSSSAASSLFGKVYVCGGNKDVFCEVFDEEKNTWERLMFNKTPANYISPGVISVFKDVILVFGGAYSKDSPSNEAEKFYLNDKKSAEIIPLSKAGKFSWGSHVIKDGVFHSAMVFGPLNEFIEWKMIEKISFSE